MRDLILITHIISSLLVCILTFFLVIRSFIALKKKLKVKKIDTSLPLWILVFLYVQLALGMILFIYILANYNSNDARIAEGGKYWMRFWAVEHFTLMVFTVVLAHIGYIYNKNSKTPVTIYKKNFLYFGITFVLICLSMVMGVVR